MPLVEPTTPFNLVLDPGEVATNRTQMFLHNGPILIEQAGIDWGDAAIQAYVADMAIGSTPVDYRIPNRIITIPFGLGMDETGIEGFNWAKTVLQQKVSLIQREHGWLKRSTDNGTMYADLVNATLTIPDHWGDPGGIEPECKLVLEALPDFYGDEILLDLIHADQGFLSKVLTQGGNPALIQGDYPGRARIMMTSRAVEERNVWWAFRSRYYDSSPTAGLHLTADQVQARSSSSALVTRSGSVSSQVISQAPSGTGWDYVAEVSFPAGYATHVGMYRVWARVQSDLGPPPLVRLVWDLGDLYDPIENKPTALANIFPPFYGGFGSPLWQVIDLGTINIPRSVVGPQAWLGNIEINGSSGEDFQFDELYLQPLDDFSGHAISSETNIADYVVKALTTSEFRWDGLERAATVGYRPISTVFGDLPRIPPSGVEGRPCELFMKACQGAFVPDVNIPDLTLDIEPNPFDVQVAYRPSYIFRP